MMNNNDMNMNIEFTLSTLPDNANPGVPHDGYILAANIYGDFEFNPMVQSTPSSTISPIFSVGNLNNTSVSTTSSYVHIDDLNKAPHALATSANNMLPNTIHNSGYHRQQVLQQQHIPQQSHSCNSILCFDPSTLQNMLSRMGYLESRMLQPQERTNSGLENMKKNLTPVATSSSSLSTNGASCFHNMKDFNNIDSSLKINDNNNIYDLEASSSDYNTEKRKRKSRENNSTVKRKPNSIYGYKTQSESNDKSKEFKFIYVTMNALREREENKTRN